MRKTAVAALILVVVILLLVALLPYLSNKENITYEEAVSKWAKGKFVTVDNKKVHFLEQGEGKPVILIHGFLYHSVMWKKNIEALAKGFKVYAVDLWGWGFSERLRDPKYSFELYGRQIVGFMDALKIDKASLVGQSMGGGVSVYVAAHFPERVDRLILVDPAVIPFPMSTTGRIYQLPLVGEFLNAIPGNALIKRNIQTVWFHDPQKVTDEYVEEVARPLAIKGNKAILIVHGREDRAIPLDRSQKLNALWKGSRLVVFEKAGHTPQEEHPEQFNQLALEFLSR